MTFTRKRFAAMAVEDSFPLAKVDWPRSNLVINLLCCLPQNCQVQTSLQRRGGLDAPAGLIVEMFQHLLLLQCLFVSVGAFLWKRHDFESIARDVLKLPLPFTLVWRKDNASPLLTRFFADARSVLEAKTLP